MSAKEEVAAPLAREAALSEAAQIRSDARAGAHRMIEHARQEAEAVRTAAEAEARAIVAEAELSAERTRGSAAMAAEQFRREAIQMRERALRESAEERTRLRDEVLLDAARIRNNAVHEVAGFVRRLDDERDQLLQAARAQAEAIVNAAGVGAPAEHAPVRPHADEPSWPNADEALSAWISPADPIDVAPGPSSVTPHTVAAPRAEPDVEALFGPEPTRVVRIEPAPHGPATSERRRRSFLRRRSS